MLTLRLTDTQGTVELEHEIPAHKITLQNFVVKFNSQANADANPIVYFNVPWIGTSQTLTNSGFNKFPLVIDGTTANNSSHGVGLEFSLHSTIPRHFQYTLTDLNNDLLSDAVLLEATVQFVYTRDPL